MATQDTFEVKFTSREVSAWGGLALLKRMLDGLGFKAAMQSWDLPQPGSNRGYAPEQLIEQMIVSIWCGAARFVHADITRLDSTLVRLFGWSKAAGHKAIVRLFQRFDQMRSSSAVRRRTQQSGYGLCFISSPVTSRSWRSSTCPMLVAARVRTGHWKPRSLKPKHPLRLRHQRSEFLDSAG